MKKETISYFERINWLDNTKAITIDEAMDIIRSGDLELGVTCPNENFSLKYITAYIHYLRNHPKEMDIQTCKLQFLPAVCINGIWHDNQLVEYSGITAMDFDHIGSTEYMRIHDILKSIHCVRNIFRTPSGEGLKAIVAHDNSDPEKHGDLYAQLLELFSKTTGVMPDTSCKDLKRRHYLCYDPDVWTNPNTIPFHYVPSLDYTDRVLEHKEKSSVAVDVDCSISDRSVLYMLKSRCRRFHPEYLIEGHRRNGVFWFGCMCGKAGVDYDTGVNFVIDLFKGDEIRLIAGNNIDQIEIEDNFKSGYMREDYDDEFRKAFNRKN